MGQQSWANSKDSKKLADKNFKNNIILTNTERLSLGKLKLRRTIM